MIALSAALARACYHSCLLSIHDCVCYDSCGCYHSCVLCHNYVYCVVVVSVLNSLITTSITVYCAQILVASFPANGLSVSKSVHICISLKMQLHIIKFYEFLKIHFKFAQISLSASQLSVSWLLVTLYLLLIFILYPANPHCVLIKILRIL